jgi:hypothetical protein
MRDFCELCVAIEEGVYAGLDVGPLLDRWNRRARSTYSAHDFTTYYGAISKEDFVNDALLPAPALVEDLGYDELRSVLEAVIAAQPPDGELSYYLTWLEKNLPGSGISDLIYWPNEWFKDPDKLHIDLTLDQILRYAMLRSNREFAGAPEHVSLPFPLPPASG